MKTACKTEGDQTYFIVYELDPLAYEGAQHLAFMPYEDGLAKVYPASTPHLDQFYQHFAQVGEEMISQRAGARPVPWEKALEALLQRLDGQNINWWLVGSAALATRGMDITPGDLDLVTDEAGSQRLGKLLCDVLIGPIEDATGWISHWFGRSFLHACIEWIGEPVASSDENGVTEFGPLAASQLDTIDWHGYSLRVPPLTIQLAVNERRGLERRVQEIHRQIKLTA